jgi:choline kinase
LTEAIVLAAGAGTRLRDVAPIKPLTRVAGKPLVAHVIEGLAAAGISRVVVVTGYEAATVEAALASRPWPCVVEHVRNADWTAPNGVSALAAAATVRGRALLTMSDHIVDPQIYRLLVAANDGDAALGVDRRLDHHWVDLDDVTRVRTKGSHIVDIGKGLGNYDAYDTGVFAVSQRFFERLASLAAPSLSDAMRSLAIEGRAFAADTGDLCWLDVDDARAHGIAETWLAA